MKSKSKYYYDYTRNMSDEQIKNSACGKDSCKCCKGSFICPHEECKCEDKNQIGFDTWIEDLEEEEQPTCNIDNPDCENCGS